MAEQPATAAVSVPAGVTVGPGRETSATDQQGAIVQGMTFPIRTPAGSTTSVFVPYSQLDNTAQVQAMIAARVAAVQAIGG